MGERALRDQQSAPTQPSRLHINCSRLRGNTFQLLQEKRPRILLLCADPGKNNTHHRKILPTHPSDVISKAAES